MPQNELQEKDFIHEDYPKNSNSLWFWLSLMAIFSCLVWGIGSWYTKKVDAQYAHNPFLQVTNRQMSLFLWQNPQYMRIESKSKTAYLPGFQYMNKVSLDLPFADSYVEAPPEILFLYHTWKRLISSEFASRPISAAEFKEFLNYAEEWQPRNWPAAPQAYTKLVEGLGDSTVQDLQNVPFEVQQAFVGWKNFMKEGDAINAMTTTAGQLQAFLAAHPHYARNYWQNIVGDSYLRTLTQPNIDPKAVIPKEEISPFLRVALYNDQEIGPLRHKGPRTGP